MSISVCVLVGKESQNNEREKIRETTGIMKRKKLNIKVGII